MAESQKKPNNNFIAKIVKDPNQVPELLLLTGYLGASSEANHTRLYFDAQLSSYVEIPDDAILHTQDVSPDASSLDGSNVWIKRDAVLVHGKVGTQRTKAKFLEGPIVNNYMRAAAFPQEGGIGNTIAFCPPTFVGFPCGYTTLPIACTVVQVPTQEQYCPTNWHCPPPPTPHCPTHHPFAICPTKICNVGLAPMEQQAAQPLGFTFGQCITLPPGCPVITRPPACPTLACTALPPCQPVTRNSPLCPTLSTPFCGYTSSGQICPTRTPGCFPSIGICATHTPACFTHAPACQTHLFICPPQVTLAGCPLPTGNCPSFGACPSIACGFGEGGGMGF